MSGRIALVDTGVLVALYAEDDPWHARVVAWLTQLRYPLHTTESVLTETAHFLPQDRRIVLAELAQSMQLRVHTPDRAGYSRMAQLLKKYADRRCDWADASLIWLAETLATRRIATVDLADFSVYRIHGRQRFELEIL